MQDARFHRYSAGSQGALVNAYLVETGEGNIAVDGTLTVSDGRALRAQRDEVYDHKHAYLADGFHQEWLANLRRLQRELPGDAILYIGHGGPATPAHFSWQSAYVAAGHRQGGGHRRYNTRRGDSHETRRFERWHHDCVRSTG